MSKSSGNDVTHHDAMPTPIGPIQNPTLPLAAKISSAVHRIGRFRIPQVMLNDLVTARAVYRDMIVMRAEASFVDNTLMVWADHPTFEVMTPGEVVPEYVATIVAPKKMTPRRPQDLVVVWERATDGQRGAHVFDMAREGTVLPDNIAALVRVSGGVPVLAKRKKKK
jgi:hypothetical protein